MRPLWNRNGPPCSLVLATGLGVKWGVTSYTTRFYAVIYSIDPQWVGPARRQVYIVIVSNRRETPLWGNETISWRTREDVIKIFFRRRFCGSRPRAYLPVSLTTAEWADGGNCKEGMAWIRLGTTDIEKVMHYPCVITITGWALPHCMHKASIA